MIDAVEDKFEVIAADHAVAISAGVAGNAMRPDLTSVPLEGVEPSHVVVATRSVDGNRLVAAFCKLAEAYLTAVEAADPRQAALSSSKGDADGSP